MSKSSKPSSKNDKTPTQRVLTEQLVVAATTACNTVSATSNRVAPVCEMIMHVLSINKDPVLFNALEMLWEQNTIAYELLADCIEFCVQTTLSADGKVSSLLAIPVLVWSSNALPSGTLDTASVLALSKAVHQHWLTDTTDVHISHTLYTPDYLPDGFYDTHQLAHAYFAQAIKGQNLVSNFKFKPQHLDDIDHQHGTGNHALADNRFILAVVRHHPDINPIKLLLSEENKPDLALQESLWREIAHTVLADYFVGCAYDVMPPQPYYEANRNAELAIRGFSLHAAILTLITQMEVTIDDLRVVIGACYSSQFEEYRISLLLKNDETVLQGITWPLLGREELQEDLLEEILAHLKALNIHRIRLLEDTIPMEYCDDCEAPLFPDTEGDMVHITPPDDEVNPSRYVVH
ncbi:MAG: hypothetical protein RL344_862 [Pseudomonadota bacterium]|jgi:hypothetical protein